jgi:hypothetical protein
VKSLAARNAKLARLEALRKREIERRRERMHTLNKHNVRGEDGRFIPEPPLQGDVKP